jgi:exonuclease SbcD
MGTENIRILFLADTHLGFDLPFRPRVVRRRRGHDFFANFERALQPAYEGKVDLVMHGGDLYYRSRVPEALVQMALAPLVKVAEIGIPVYIVPGNHERSRIPLNLWSIHPNLHIFDQAKTYLCEIRGVKLALSGFPFARKIRDKFGELIVETGYENIKSDIRVLCLHQTVEGAQVGPSNYTFRSGVDVIRGEDIPDAFCIVLAGHIHRAQMLTTDLGRKPLNAPVLYPGSVERTSFAERKEGKKFTLVELAPDGSKKGQLMSVQFVPLPVRPMMTLVLETEGKTIDELKLFLKSKFAEFDADAVVRIQIRGAVSEALSQVIKAEYLRALAPSSMNVSITYPRSVDSIASRER